MFTPWPSFYCIESVEDWHLCHLLFFDFFALSIPFVLCTKCSTPSTECVRNISQQWRYIFKFFITSHFSFFISSFFIFRVSQCFVFCYFLVVIFMHGLFFEWNIYWWLDCVGKLEIFFRTIPPKWMMMTMVVLYSNNLHTAWLNATLNSQNKNECNKKQNRLLQLIVSSLFISFLLFLI